jgi:hypothetical protein
MNVARRHAARIVALLIILAVYLATGLPSLDAEERRVIAERFQFTGLPLEPWPGGLRQTQRTVNPFLARHRAWISAVGAAVALADLDADGLANDLCQVDPRTDLVTLAPVPGTGARYGIFALEPRPLAYDARVMAPMGCVPGDFNEDGRMDLFVYYWGRTPVLFLRTSTSGVLGPASFVARELSATAERWYSMAASFADLDGDGHLDLLIGNYFQDGARILDAEATAPDSMQHSMSRAFNGGRNRLFLFEGATAGPAPNVIFQEIVDVFPARADTAWTLAIGAADLDGDLLPEIYFANDFGPDRFFHNRSTPGTPRFALLEGERDLVTPRSKVLGADSFKGMGIDFADVNGDGELDIFVSNIADEYALLESHFLFVRQHDPTAMLEGRAPYREQSEALGVARSGWGWDTRFGDFDNDGVPEALQATGFAKGEVDRWPELQELATANDELLALAGAWPNLDVGDDLSGDAPNPFYVKARDGRYYDLAAELGLAAEQVTRGIATADVDGDGDLDFAIANQWEASVFYRNDLEQRVEANPFLGLHLLLPTAGPGDFSLTPGHPSGFRATRPAVGASVRVGLSEARILVGQVDGGNGHSGVRSPELHFGLGRWDAATPVSVEVRYRDRSGNPAQLSLELTPGWHTLVLPDADQALAMRPGELAVASRPLERVMP